MTARLGEWHVVALLLAAALPLHLAGLGEPALRDWDEAYTAGVAYGIARDGISAWWWTTYWGEPFDKPPLVHGLVALSLRLFGPDEFAARLPGALLSAASVPMLYLAARQMQLARGPALLGALVYLTLLPVVRHGRLAMLDAAIVFFMLVMAWFLFASRARPALAWGAGAALAAMTMTKGMLGPLLAACLLLALVWSRPAVLRSPHLWLAMPFGMVLPALWLWSQAVHFGGESAGFLFWSAGIGRVVDSMSGHAGPFWYYLVENLKFTGLWLALVPAGL